MVGEIVSRLREGDAAALAQQVESEPSLSAALRLLLSKGALVVLDDFQRLLDSSAQPVDPLGSKLQQLARRAPDGGCLWLVTNRVVDPAWTEQFYEAFLEAPAELADSERITLQAIGRADAEDRFPLDRRLEVIRRVGANPRVLRLLGTLLRIYPLGELMGPPADIPVAPVPQLLVQIACDIALYRLAQTADVRTDEHRTRYDDALATLKRLSRGEMMLPPPPPDPNAPLTLDGPRPIVVTGPERLFSRDKTRDL